jgi:hypothetical protein
VWEIHPVMKMEFGLMRLIPLPKCRMIRDILVMALTQQAASGRPHHFKGRE